jgi:hypothetical protein
VLQQNRMLITSMSGYVYLYYTYVDFVSDSL